MASSGTFRGTANRTEPYLIADWKVLQKDTSKNRSKIKVTLKLYNRYTINHQGSRSGSIKITPGGTHNFTHSASRVSSGERTWVLTEYEVWVNHKNDGTQTFKLDARFDISDLWWGTTKRTITVFTVSGSATLDRIERGSTLNSVEINNSTIQSGQTRVLTVDVSKPNNLYNDILQIYDNGKWIAEWSELSNGRQQLTMTSSDIEKIINTMGTSTSKELLVRFSSRDKNNTSIVIGDFTYSTLNVNLSTSSSQPKISSVSIGIHGSGRDSNLNQYIQGKSRASVSFSVDPGSGATLANVNATMGDGKDVSFGSFNSSDSTYSGTTPIINGSGNIIIRLTATNSRGETASSDRLIKVTPYSPPIINNFTIDRVSGSNQINVNYSGSYTTLGTTSNYYRSTNNNTLRIALKKKSSSDRTFSQMGSTTNITSGSSFSTSTSYSDFSQTDSYEFRLEVRDDFGTIVSETSVSTGKVLLSLNQDIGVGIGKYHENGVLDINGKVYVDGLLKTSMLVTSSANVDSLRAKNSINTDSTMSATSFLASNYVTAGLILAKNRLRVNGADVVVSGSNDNGMYIKLYDGTLICCCKVSGIRYRKNVDHTFPHTFIEEPFVTATARRSGGYYNVTVMIQSITNEAVKLGGGHDDTSNINAEVIAIGRWK